MSRAVIIGAIVALLCLGAVNGGAIKWTGYGGDNQWTNRLNWSPDTVPGTNDDVTIDEGTVQVTIPTGCNSLVMGTRISAPANVTFFQTFYVGTGGMEVDLNGNVFLNAGTASVTGTVQMGGNLFFQSGQISGQWTIMNRANADLSGPAEKVLSGCSLAVAGQFTLQGVLVLNQSSQLTVTSNAVLSQDISIQAQDTSAVLFDTSKGTLTYNGGGTFQIQAPVNIGNFTFIGGNLSIYNAMTFANAFVIPSGSYVSTVGSAIVDMSAGVSGSGVLSAAGVNLLIGSANISGYTNLVGGNLTIKSASWFNVLTVSGGFVILNAGASCAQLNLLNGNLKGSGGITAASLTANSAGINLDTALTITSTGTNTAKTLFAFGKMGSFTISAGAVYTVMHTLTFTGTPGQNVMNNGAIKSSAAVLFQGINLLGTGTVSTSSTFALSTMSVTQSSVTLSGSGSFTGSTVTISSIAKVIATPTVLATFGSYTVTCGKECDNVSTATQPNSPFSFVVGTSSVRLH